MNPLDLARPEIRTLKPYSSARSEGGTGAVLLNANESPWPPCANGRAWNRYPEPQPAALVARLAGLYRVPAPCVLVGRGSDEGIDLLVRAFCAAGRDAILLLPPTFGMYAVSAGIQGARVIEAPPRPDFSIPVQAVLAACTPGVKLVFACAPNNPTGTGIPRATLLELAGALRDRALLVVDEAYIEFADPDGGCRSVSDCVARFPNLVVLRTLSKAWALAGVRIGTLIADPRVAALLRKLLPAYPLPRPSVDAALQLLSAAGERAMHARCARIRNERARLRAGLAALGCVRRVLPTQANFIAVRFEDAGTAFAALLADGVVVRDLRRYPRLGDALRITIGTPAENDCVLTALRALHGASLRPARAEQPA